MTKGSRSRSAQRSERLRSGLGCVLGLMLFCGLDHAVAQDTGQLLSPILTIDSDRLYSESAYGQQTARDFEARGAALAAENRSIEEELTAEEKALTEQRASMTPAEFRMLADAFDEKVQAVRRQQDAKTRELNKALEESRIVFLNSAVPVLETLMRDAGAGVVLERRSVFLSANAIDITREAIERLDETLGDGSEVTKP